MARDCAILRQTHARFHVRCLCIRETGVIAYGQGALGPQRGLDAVDDEQRVMLLGQQSGRIVELALQRLSGLALSHHRLHVQGLDVQVVIFSSGKSGFQRINVVWNDSDGKMAVRMLETGQVLLVCIPAAVAESSGAVSETRVRLNVRDSTRAEEVDARPAVETAFENDDGAAAPLVHCTRVRH